MSINILMPALSPTMTEGILQKWFIKIGDKVKAGDVIAEIETDKATMELEAVDEGEITNIIIEDGTERVQINTVIAVLNGNKNEKFVEPSTQIKESKESKKNHINIKENIEDKDKSNQQQIKIQDSLKNKTNRLIASPLAKKIANDQNINLANLKGSGPNGRIIKRDFDKVTLKEKQLITYSEHEIIEPSSIRKIIAEKTTETKNNVPHFYLTIESNVDKLLILREQINNQLNYKISINDILVKALAIAQKNNPEANVSWHNNKIIKYSSADVSVAVALKEGLVTPIIYNADSKGLLEISLEIKELIKKSRQGALTPKDYLGGTISISNLGMYKINEFSAIINSPQSMILAVGLISKTIKIEEKKIIKTNVIKFTLSVDHRAIDGATAAKFLNNFNDIVENPFDIWLQSNDMKII